MPKRILVPLDQTAEAESIVSVVADMARGGGATVRLLHVAPMPDAIVDGEPVAGPAGREMARLEGEARDYLAAVELGFDGVPVEIAVRFGAAADAILNEAGDFGADLVAVTTGSGPPLRRPPLGRVAEQLIRRARAPVLILRPQG